MARGDGRPRPRQQAAPLRASGRWGWGSGRRRADSPHGQRHLDDGLLAQDSSAKPVPSPRPHDGPRISLVTSLLIAILLFALGQTAGETAAYLTDSQNVNANAFNAATLFAPAGVAANAAGTTITVSWSAVGFSIDGYNVYRSTSSGGPYTRVNGAVVTGTSYPDSGLAAGTYYYVVRLVNARGTESATNSSQASATADGTAPTSTMSTPTNGGYVTTSPFSITGTA